MEFEGSKASHIGECSCESIVKGFENRKMGLKSHPKSPHATCEAGIFGEEKDDEGILGGYADRNVAEEMALCDVCKVG